MDWAYAPHCFFGMFGIAAFVWAICTFGLQLAGVPVEFFFLDGVALFLSVGVAVVGTSELMKMAYRWQCDAEYNDAARIEGDENPDCAQNMHSERFSSSIAKYICSMEAEVLGACMMALVLIGCKCRSFVRLRFSHTNSRRADPCIVLPVYRSSSTSDLTRVVISCVIHPLAQEFVISAHRVTCVNKKKTERALIEDPQLHYLILRDLNLSFLSESIFVSKSPSDATLSDSF